MLERNEGRVVNVESPTAYAPIPGATAYQTARYALRGFGESLRMDLHSTDVGVASVVPGKVRTKYFDRNENVEERFPETAERLRVLDPEEVAEAAVAGLREEKRYVYLPRELRLLLLGRRLLPRTVDAWTARNAWQPSDVD
jgi:short-subunit dehydrogenase